MIIVKTLWMWFLEQEESKNWVTKENLEEKIAYCLEHETNYNFALTSTGEKVFSDSTPGSVDTEENGPGPSAYVSRVSRTQSQYNFR